MLVQPPMSRASFAMRALFALCLFPACGSSSGGGNGIDAGNTSGIDARFTGDGNPGACGQLPPAPGANVEIAPEYAGLYSVYDLGPPPGVPSPLGGAVIKVDDPNTLLIAGASERADGAIYSIGVTRNACGHIIGFSGTAQVYANTPYVDANLVYRNPNLLLFTEWPVIRFSQLQIGDTATSATLDLTTVGVVGSPDQGPGGLGIVPPGNAAAGELRMVSWPEGRWYRVTSSVVGGFEQISATQQVSILPNNPGGFAYVPAGSPGFASQHVIVAEWVMGDPSRDRVAVYQVDSNGDPMIATRKDFMTRFPRPWGAYFEPVTGDYVFLSWGAGGEDRVYIVQGFVPPPPIE